MAGKRLTRAESQQRTRERLLRAARELFAKHGIDATSLEKIAARAGVTRGAIYANFKNKVELVRAISEQNKSATDAEFTTIATGLLDDHLTLEELIRSIGREYFEGFAKMPAADAREAFLLRYEMLLFAFRTPAARKQMAAENRAAAQRLGQLLEHMADREGRELRAAGAELIVVLMAIIKGLGELAAIDPGLVTPEMAGDAWAMLVARPADD